MKFKSSLILCPKRYSLAFIFKEILEQISDEVTLVDLNEDIPVMNKKIRTQMFRFPFVIRNRYEGFFLKKVDALIREKYDKAKPDLVFVYNSEFLSPETCEYIKKKSKLIFFLGDSPFFTPMNNFFLTVLGYGDLILAPDTFWVQQMRTVGYKNVDFFVPGFDNKNYYKMTPDEISKHPSVKEQEIFYSGRCYVDSWGYKKAMLMSKFVDFDFSVYGSRHWKKWFRFFPELEKCYTENDFIETPVLNVMYNKTKIVPVDGNPGILNGFHIRMMESLAAGTLPVVEYRKDVEMEIFKGTNLQVPLIRDYDKAKDLVSYFLKNDNERNDLIKATSQFIQTEYNASRNGIRILEYLNR